MCFKVQPIHVLLILPSYSIEPISRRYCISLSCIFCLLLLNGWSTASICGCTERRIRNQIIKRRGSGVVVVQVKINKKEVQLYPTPDTFIHLSKNNNNLYYNEPPKRRLQRRVFIFSFSSTPNQERESWLLGLLHYFIKASLLVFLVT